ncbi:hypothetical protein [Oryza sativa Japonica Group]|uniref:Uncharacterized protein n=1 Tax=Oryza sativa subsp. japonica TaxID=39947 RepID=Q8LRI1_ORYSJ|nr:hypothetical protein [Oryza sativa Japonica Group]
MTLNLWFVYGAYNQNTEHIACLPMVWDNQPMAAICRRCSWSRTEAENKQLIDKLLHWRSNLMAQWVECVHGMADVVDDIIYLSVKAHDGCFGLGSVSVRELKQLTNYFLRFTI